MRKVISGVKRKALDFSHDLENFSEPAAVRLKSSLSLQFLTVDGRWEDTASYARYGVYDEHGFRV